MVKKTLFPDILFNGIEKKDGYIALIYSLSIFFISLFLLYVIKHSQLYSLIINEVVNIYDVVFGFIMTAPDFVIILVILKKRGQKINTIGFRKKGILSSIIIGTVLFLLFLRVYLASDNINISLLYNILFYVFFIGFHEEIVFRGFIWPRLVKAYGKLYGTLISGLIFGALHLPIDIVWKNVSVFDAVVLGKVSNVSILGGVVGALIYSYIYTRNNNILLPSIVHGILNLCSVL